MILGIIFANLGLFLALTLAKMPIFANLALVFGMGLSKKKKWALEPGFSGSSTYPGLRGALGP